MMAQCAENRPNKKEYSELIFAVQWKTRFINGVETANSIFSMCDYPATTSKWENFKEYLLTHSGAPPHGDIRVHYVTFEGNEACIDSQEAFEMALTMFRTVSQQNKIINITVEMLAGAKKKNMQVMYKNEPAKKEAQVGTTAVQDNANPPQWFLKYMTEFKEDILSQVQSEIRSLVDVINKSQAAVANPKVKSKTRSEYKSRRNVLLAEASKEKELHKYERKLERLAEASKEKELHKYERKLEKIEAKSKKDSKKKHGSQDMPMNVFKKNLLDRLTALNETEQLFSEGHQVNPDKGPLVDELVDETTSDAAIDITAIESDMDARAVSVDAPDTSSVRVCLGEKLYVHRWRVCNKGKLTWDNNTELRHTWGSTRFLPVEKVIKLPHLAPNQSQLVNVAFHVPVEAGVYECYWHFHHRGIRFGHWISCCITVMDPIPSRRSNLESKVIMPEKTQETVEETAKANGTSVCDFEAGNGKSICSGLHNLQLSQDEDYNSSDSAYSICGGNTSLDEPDFCILSVPDRAQDSQDEKTVRHLDLVQGRANTKVVEFTPSNRRPGIYGLYEDIMISRGEIDDYGDDEEIQPKESKEAAGGSVSDGGESFVQVDSSIPVESLKSEEANGNEDTTIQTKETIEGYAYVTFNSKKVAIPKRFLRPDFLQTAEVAPGPEQQPEVNNNQSDLPNVPQADDPEVRPSDEVASSDSSQPPLELSKHIKITRQPLFYSEEIKVAKAGPNLTESIPKAENKIGTDHKVNIGGNLGADHRRFEVYPRIYSPCSSVPDLIDPQNLTTPGNGTSKRDYDPMAPKNSPVYSASVERAFRAYCSATGSNFSDNRSCMNDGGQSNSRLFVFPQNYPGYEVIHPPEVQVNKYSSSDNRGNGDATNVYQEPATFQAVSDVQQPVAHPSPCSAGSHCPPYYMCPPLLHFRSPPVVDYSHRNYQYPEQNPCAWTRHLTGSSYGTQDAPGYPPGFSPEVYPPLWEWDVHCGDNKGCNSPKASVASEQGPKNHPEPTPSTVHILPETLVAGAVNVASSAINTAKSVINMIKPKPEPGKWENGHWLSSDPGTTRENNLLILTDMGFTNRDLNATLLARYNDDLSRVIAELLN